MCFHSDTLELLMPNLAATAFSGTQHKSKIRNGEGVDAVMCRRIVSRIDGSAGMGFRSFAERLPGGDDEPGKRALNTIA